MTLNIRIQSYEILVELLALKFNLHYGGRQITYRYI